MDCEKFESILIDELYEELDELTSAAAKRHVAGCARCAALFSGLKATRRVAVLPMVSTPVDLEERILAATRDAQKVVPINVNRRLSEAISWAGSWAMRPQTAMAAVFLLMVGFGSSVLFRRSKANAPSSEGMTITAEGSPAAASAAPVGQGAPEDFAKVDPTTAAAAHGAPLPVAAATAAPPPAIAFASAPPGTPASSGSLDMEPRDKVASDRERANGMLALEESKGEYGKAYRAASGGGGPVARAASPVAMNDPAPVHYSAPPPPAAPVMAPAAQAVAAQAGLASSDDAVSPFDSAMALYRTGNYDGATRAFDALATADAGAALWAARSVREGAGGCTAATSRFDAVALRSFGTRVGYDATLEGGQCWRDRGSIEVARRHFTRLLTVPEYAARAQSAIDGLSQIAAQKAAPAKPAAKAAAPSAQQQQQPQAPARAPATQGY